MNIRDKEDDRLVIIALAELYSKYSQEVERCNERPSAFNDRQASEYTAYMERINKMLTRWKSPE